MKRMKCIYIYTYMKHTHIINRNIKRKCNNMKKLYNQNNLAGE